MRPVIEREGVMTKPAVGSPVVLADLVVRPVVDAAERARWDRLMDTHHYLGFRGMFGGSLRHVAETPDGRWISLLGWCSGSFKVGVRDKWIGWAREQQFRRLHLVANNARFLILPGFNGGNVASRVLSLSLGRLSGDFEARRGHPVLLAETFVDPSRFRGACYRASNWTELGETSGYARRHGGWENHGHPKRVWVRPLGRRARRDLGGLDEPESWGAGRVDPALPGEARLRSLYDFLESVDEYRSARGIRHRLATVLAISVAAKLAGARGPVAIAEFAARLDQGQLVAVRAFRSPTLGRLVPPSKSSVHRILSELDPDALDGAARRWTASPRGSSGALAVDGKSKPRNHSHGPDPERMLIAAVEHGSGVIRGQTASGSAGGEIVGARTLLRELGVAGCIITMDALHSCPKTARLITGGGGDYVIPVKRNQPALLDDIRRLDFDAAPSHGTREKGHGRIEERVCALVALDDTDVAALPGRRQAFRITRHRTVVKTGQTSV